MLFLISDLVRNICDVLWLAVDTYSVQEKSVQECQLLTILSVWLKLMDGHWVVFGSSD
ncbi:unnamed protein product [Rhodiola kirilowii]